MNSTLLGSLDNFGEDLVEDLFEDQNADDTYDFEDDFIASESEPTIYDEDEEEVMWICLSKKALALYERFLEQNKIRVIKEDYSPKKGKKRRLIPGDKFEKMEKKKTKINRINVKEQF